MMGTCSRLKKVLCVVLCVYRVDSVVLCVYRVDNRRWGGLGV